MSFANNVKMERNQAIVESIRELNEMFFETGDISKEEYEATKRDFPFSEDSSEKVATESVPPNSCNESSDK